MYELRKAVALKMQESEKLTVLITGSSKGLGESLALVFAKNKYNIILHGRNEKMIEEVRKKVVANNVKCEAIVGDLRQNETIEKLFESVKRNNVFVLINNAGIGMAKSFNDISMEEFENVLEINLISPIKLIKKIYPLFVKKGKGIIININSGDGLKTGELKTAYSTSKFGLKGFTDALRYESKKKKIKVIGVYPGGMKTDMYTAGGVDASKCMSPSEVAEIIYCLCKDSPSLLVDEIVLNRMEY